MNMWLVAVTVMLVVAIVSLEDHHPLLEICFKDGHVHSGWSENILFSWEDYPLNMLRLPHTYICVHTRLYIHKRMYSHYRIFLIQYNMYVLVLENRR